MVDNPGTLTVVVAGIVLVAGALGPLASIVLDVWSGRAMRRARSASAEEVAAPGRLATVQMHKREVYASLIDAIQAYIAADGQTDDREVMDCINRALAVAHAQLRVSLIGLQEDLTVLQGPAAHRELLERLMVDLRQEGRDT